MESGIAIMVSALILTKSECQELARNPSGRSQGVKYAIGEFGGFTFHIGGRRFYPIMVSEKRRCGLRATAKGENVHGSLFLQANPVGALGRFL